MSVSSRQRPSLTSPSNASIQHTASVRSTNIRRPPPPITTVVTTPPWARDEPPSPKDPTSPVDITQPPEPHPSDAASYITSPDPSSRWWTFTLPRTGRQQWYPEISSPTTAKPDRKGIKDISISSWLQPSSSTRDINGYTRKDKEKDPELGQHNGIERGWDLPTAAPTPSPAQYTLAHTSTPGWDDPWSPRTAVQGPVRNNLDRESSYDLEPVEESADSDKSGNKWRRRKKRFRVFILSNIYVPLLFRMINITFTASALAVAIRIRRMEISVHSMGAVGSSPPFSSTSVLFFDATPSADTSSQMVFTISSDYIYVIAMLKTTPLVVTIGLSLTIPLAVIGDLILGRAIRGLVLVGAVLVIAGFVMVGLDDSRIRSAAGNAQVEDSLERTD
ncbi:hypothetical protein C0991_000091 [Blastosporella zonata]|nr:hypothetical protein C0991_000091 [Blastosporella zonata]